VRPRPAGLWRQDLLVTAAVLVALIVWDASGADLALTRVFGSADGFAWREHWLTSGVLHEGGRLAAWGLFALGLLNIWRPLTAGPSKSERVRWVLVTLACVIAVPALKRLTSTSCPCELAEFGGAASYVSHWHFGVDDGGAGHCFPSGHAVSEFAFFSGWFVLRRHRPRVARTWLAAVLVAGLLFGGAQLVRGAHYASHTLWTGWLCWLIGVVTAPRARRVQAPSASRIASITPL
jgi:membrane-associated PAP2 superfamily phosphatase